tara:strand:- start:301 stop:918 length:618 start_codon:yes stop_codon:yes gene_type:complete
MNISYAITVCNEFDELKRLLELLLNYKRKEDEVVVLFDKGNGTPEVWSYLQKNKKHIKLEAKTFKHHFADWKNYLSSLCSGSYIFQIDADEYMKHEFITLLPSILKSNSNIDMFLVPRINTVEGLTQEYINKWRWNVDEKGWVNFPDYQYRIWKNIEDIKWVNKVHEILVGYKEYCTLPGDSLYCLIHPKTIERQEKQNNFYDTL